LAHRVVAQALNLDDIAFFLWWLTFAALTKIGDNPNATVFLEVLVKRSLHASDAVVPGLAEADAALRAMLHPHAESWYMQHGLGVHAAVMAQQVRDPYPRWHLRTARAVCANEEVPHVVPFVAASHSLHTHARSKHVPHVRTTAHIGRVRTRGRTHAGVLLRMSASLRARINPQSATIQPVNCHSNHNRAQTRTHNPTIPSHTHKSTRTRTHASVGAG
jgi:hypothetical protein